MDIKHNRLDIRGFVLWWTLASLIGYALTLALAKISPLLGDSFGLLLLPPLGALLLAVSQSCIIHVYMQNLGWWGWFRSTLVGLAWAIAADLLVGICGVGAVIISRGSSGGDYMPYAATMALIFVGFVAVLVVWFGLWVSIVAQQWRVLAPFAAQSRLFRNLWFIASIGLQTALAFAGMWLLTAEQRRL